ncbi:chemotaxis protein CheW [Deinococcus sp. VB343]|uniref:chemotaxis protein CheW n=1 Tax=Deinococcus sp. VB343 TaxID=3385567 RepID=UPI0039C9DBA8
MNLLLFRVGSRVLTLPADLIRQVRALDTLSPLPGSGGALLGLTVVAGRAVPVLNLRQLVGMPAAEVPARLLLVSLQEQLFLPACGRRAGLCRGRAAGQRPAVARKRHRPAERGTTGPAPQPRRAARRTQPPPDPGVTPAEFPAPHRKVRQTEPSRFRPRNIRHD